MSIGAVFGLVPFLVSSSVWYVISYKVLYHHIPNLFEFSSVPIDYRGLGIDPPKQWQPQATGTKARFSQGETFSKSVSHVFATSFSTSLLIMHLSLCEIGDFLNRDSRLILWHLVIPISTVLLVFVIPLMISANIIDRFSHGALSAHRNLNLVILAAAILCWLYFLSELDMITGIQTDGAHHNLFSKWVSELTLLGITAIAALGGVGTISNPFYELFKKQKPLSKFETDRVVANLKTTEQVLKLRQEEIERFQAQYGVGSTNKELKLLEEETAAILRLKNSLNADLVKMTYELHAQRDKDKLRFKMVKFARKLFSVYCLYRMVSLFLIKLPRLMFHKLLHDDDIGQDALAVTIAKLMTATQDNIDEDALVNQLSFILSGSLFLGSVSSVVNTFHSLSRLIPHSIRSWAHASSSTSSEKKKSVFRSLLLSELLGIYTLATTLLLRSNLTDTISSNIDTAIGGEPLQVKFVDSWFDKVSIATCFFTLIGIAINEFINHDSFEDDEFDQEKYIQGDKFA